VAWGIECLKKDIPGVYVKVAKFREWIDIEMINLGFGTASYTF
jgi:secreted trypsin-like serine protease